MDSGVAKGGGAVVVALLVEEAFEFVSVVGLVLGGAFEEGAHGGHLVAETTVVEGCGVIVVPDRIVGFVVEEQVDDIGSGVFRGFHEGCFARIVAAVYELLEVLRSQLIECCSQEEGYQLRITVAA